MGFKNETKANGRKSGFRFFIFVVESADKLSAKHFGGVPHGLENRLKAIDNLSRCNSKSCKRRPRRRGFLVGIAAVIFLGEPM